MDLVKLSIFICICQTNHSVAVNQKVKTLNVYGKEIHYLFVMLLTSAREDLNQVQVIVHKSVPYFFFKSLDQSLGLYKLRSK